MSQSRTYGQQDKVEQQGENHIQTAPKKTQVNPFLSNESSMSPSTKLQEIIVSDYKKGSFSSVLKQEDRIQKQAQINLSEEANLIRLNRKMKLILKQIQNLKLEDQILKELKQILEEQQNCQIQLLKRELQQTSAKRKNYKQIKCLFKSQKVNSSKLQQLKEDFETIQKSLECVTNNLHTFQKYHTKLSREILDQSLKQNNKQNFKNQTDTFVHTVVNNGPLNAMQAVSQMPLFTKKNPSYLINMGDLAIQNATCLFSQKQPHKSDLQISLFTNQSQNYHKKAGQKRVRVHRKEDERVRF